MKDNEMYPRSDNALCTSKRVMSFEVLFYISEKVKPPQEKIVFKYDTI